MKNFIEKQLVEVDYLTQGGVDRDDEKTMRLCMEVRLRNRHSQKENPSVVGRTT